MTATDCRARSSTASRTIERDAANRDERHSVRAGARATPHALRARPTARSRSLWCRSRRPDQSPDTKSVRRNAASICAGVCVDSPTIACSPSIEPNRRRVGDRPVRRGPRRPGQPRDIRAIVHDDLRGRGPARSTIATVSSSSRPEGARLARTCSSRRAAVQTGGREVDERPAGALADVSVADDIEGREKWTMHGSRLFFRLYASWSRTNVDVQTASASWRAWPPREELFHERRAQPAGDEIGIVEDRGAAEWRS